MDRETVITHLQIIYTWAEFARERDLQFFTAKHLEDIAKWSDDAIAMLKEQEDIINELQNAYGYLQEQFFKVQDKLLKEQEANTLRCKECVYHRNDGWCNEHGREVKESDYCSFGAW